MPAPDYRYLLSLPERATRSLSALSGGLLYHLGEVVLPDEVREMALYRATAGIALRFLIEEAGGVRGIYPPDEHVSRKFLFRYAVGTSIELTSIAHFLVSPVWVLAALGDAAKVGRVLVGEVADALQQEGLIEPHTEVGTLEQLLDALEQTSTHAALAVNMPPLDIATLRWDLRKFREELALFPAALLVRGEEIENVWTEVKSTAARLEVPVTAVSAAMGVSALARVPAEVHWLSRAAGTVARRTGEVAGRVLLNHYSMSLREMAREGFPEYWGRELRPYAVAAIGQMLPERKSWTERLLAKFD